MYFQRQSNLDALRIIATLVMESIQNQLNLKVILVFDVVKHSMTNVLINRVLKDLDLNTIISALII
jgi:hypothetical protein